MKTVILATAFAIAGLTAADAKTVYYPKNACAEIVSAEYSTGGGDSAIELYEILCKSADGKYTSFVTSWGSAAGLLGWGRAFHEEVINLIPYDGDKLTAE